MRLINAPAASLSTPRLPGWAEVGQRGWARRRRSSTEAGRPRSAAEIALIAHEKRVLGLLHPGASTDEPNRSPRMRAEQFQSREAGAPNAASTPLASTRARGPMMRAMPNWPWMG